MKIRKKSNSVVAGVGIAIIAMLLLAGIALAGDVVEAVKASPAKDVEAVTNDTLARVNETAVAIDEVLAQTNEVSNQVEDLAKVAADLVKVTADSATADDMAKILDAVADLAAALPETDAAAPDLVCEVVPLDAYGFDGADGEAVCADPDNAADFIIVTGFEVGDKLTIYAE